MITTLELNSVVQEYPDPQNHGQVNRILDPLTLTLAGPSINVIMGRSGCGKSTVLRMLGGVRPPKVKTPTSGTIKLDGVELLGKSPDAITVFQQPVNRPDLTVKGNIEFPFKVGPRRGTKKEEIAALVEEAMVAVSLKDKESHYPSELSGGQNQRVMLARGLVTKPKILLLDEPFSALDPILRLDMQKLLVDIWSKHPCLVVMVTHDVSEAIAVADRILVLGGKPAKVMLDHSAPGARTQALRPEDPTLHNQISQALK